LVLAGPAIAHPVVIDVLYVKSCHECQWIGCASRGKPPRQLCGRTLEVFRWWVDDARAANANSPLPKACVVWKSGARFDDNDELGHNAPHISLWGFVLYGPSSTPNMLINKLEDRRCKGGTIFSVESFGQFSNLIRETRGGA
jgi:hypothetical protein